MRTPSKWLQSVFWPISVLPSFTHVGEHPADDYVGRTSPILASAFAFWICLAALIALVMLTVGSSGQGTINGAAVYIHRSWQGLDTGLSVLTLMLVLLYIAGFWMFANREDDYPN